ncbi:MAG: DUF1761 domain-containing protein [Saprospiraceae bacterium]
MNFIIVFAAGLIPLLTGFLYYNNAFGFGKAWMAEIGLTEEDLMRDFNPLKLFGPAYILGVMIAFALMPIVIHQFGFFSMLNDVEGVNDVNTEVGKMYAFLMENYGQNFRTFKHGALHGTISAIFYVFPILAINALFERRSWKYIFIHLGFWVLTLALMGGVVCQFAVFP